MELLEQQYEMVEVARCRPHEHNPNIGDEEALADSVDTNGFFGAITVRDHPDEEGAYQILAGEHRWRLSAKRGVEQIPAIVLKDVDDVKAVRILLADNEVTRRGQYDMDALDRARATLPDLHGTGFFADVLAAAGAAKDAEDAEEESYVDEDVAEDDFAREYGVLVMVQSEVDQQKIYEELARLYGASMLRVVSV